jgi:hypothetical protein
MCEEAKWSNNRGTQLRGKICFQKEKWTLSAHGPWIVSVLNLVD